MDKMEKKELSIREVGIATLTVIGASTLAAVAIGSVASSCMRIEGLESMVKRNIEELERVRERDSKNFDRMRDLKAQILRLELEAKRAKEKAGKKSVEPTKSGTVGLMQRQPGVLRKPPVQMHPNNPVKLGRNQLARSMC